MCHSATGSGWLGRRVLFLLVIILPVAAPAQTQEGRDGTRPDWRRIGNSAIDLALASPATGPVARVWFSEDGARLFVRTAAGRVYVTSDFEKWQPSNAVPPPADDPAGTPLPEGVRAIKSSPSRSSRLYALGRQVLRSDDGGGSWMDLTAYKQRSIIGGGMRDLAVSPVDGDEVVVANDRGVWRSLDGGVTWTGLNEVLPNLPARRLAALPEGGRGIRLIADGIGVIEWAPGEKLAWRPVLDPAAREQIMARVAASEALGAQITALTAAGDTVYAGASDGRIWVSQDKGRTWGLPSFAGRGPVESIWVDPRDPRTALAALSGLRPPFVLRTINGGQYWDDLTADLPHSPAWGITADRSSGAVYVATGRGVFFTRADLNAAAAATNWSPLRGLPEAAALDVRLDPEGNQLFVTVQGYGVYAALAPHRLGDLRLVSAADFSGRPAAPGSLLSVLGGRVRTARAGELNFPVLAANDRETQIQVPFAVSPGSLSVALDTAQGSLRLALPVENVSPAIFIDRDGTPLILDADSGVLLDAMNPARSNGRIQVLATGLGRVRPDWPAGMPGPVDDPPTVIEPVRAYLDRAPVEVTRAILAPGYIGLYLVEIQLPAIVNAGPAELYLESGGRESNRTRIWLEP
ncbi:MAG TPA: hypothetical protein PLA43_08175 [Bryobacteraceae bacterium]|nr:hypothetical protein [Bryobacteraceae bacterium]HPU71919.1 hypothetical protein [Bryobacteraceae bacterium]